MTKKNILIKTIILTIATTILCFSGKTFAGALHDCDVITGNISNFQKQVFKNKIFDFSEIYPKDALELAIKNLTSYCCENILKQGIKNDPRCEDKNNLTSNYPESPYLFDHLIDVGLRRLDVLNMYANIPSDKTATERREFIIGVAASPDATVPTTITDKYATYWSLHTGRIFRKSHLKIDNMDAEDQGKLQNFLDNYDVVDGINGVSLADKYNNLCWIARNLYERKPGEKIVLGGDKLSKGRNYYTDCQTMVSSRINSENLYVKAIMINKANKMIQDNLDAMLNKQFLQDKLSGLQKIISSIRDLFQTIVKQAAVCKKCSN